MICSNCGAQIPDESMFCSYCGKRVSKQINTKKTTKRGIWVLLAIIVLAVLCVSIVYLLKEGSKTKIRKVCLLKETRFDSDGNLIDEHEYEYDAKGNLIKENYYEVDGRGWRSEHEYDANGQEVKETLFDDDGSIDSWFEYEYDTRGRRIKETEFYPDGEIDVWKEYEYDFNGNLVKETSLYPNPYRERSIGDWTEYEYDTNGNRVKESYYDSSGSIIEWTEYEYDTNGNQVKETYYDSSGTRDIWIEYKYDPYGNRVSGTYYDDSGSIYLWSKYEWQIFEYFSKPDDSASVENSKVETVATVPDAATVPESLLQVKIDECLNKWNMYDCDSTDYEIIHNPDEASHMDSVTIVFKFRYPYGYIKTDYRISYQYDQSSDLWSPVSSGQSSNSIVWDGIDCFLHSYDGVIQYADVFGVDGDTYYSINISNIDTDSKTAQVSAEVSYVIYRSGEEPYRDEVYFDGTINIDEIAYFSDMKDNPNDNVIEDLRETNADRALLKMTIDNSSKLTCWISLKRGLAIFDSDWWDPEYYEFIN